jgi:excisionase family DNA binding protein
MNAAKLDIDVLLTPAEMARVARITPRYLADKTRSGVIPAFKLGGKIRYHLRTVHAVLARRGGVPRDLIAAMFNSDVQSKSSVRQK